MPWAVALPALWAERKMTFRDVNSYVEKQLSASKDTVIDLKRDYRIEKKDFPFCDD